MSKIDIHSIATPLTPEEQPALSSLPTPSIVKNSEIDLFPTHIPATTQEDVALIESDEGDSPSPMATTGPGWSSGEEEDVETLLSVAPSEAQEQLVREVEQLERERTQQNRAAASVSNQMYKEVQVQVKVS